MNQPTVSKKKQSLLSRVFFFGLGGGFSSLLNTGIFRGAHKLLGWPEWTAYALSVVLTAFIFFLWSYYINFRTTRLWHNCIGRYLTCLLICNALNYVIGLSGIKKWGTTFLTTYLVVAAVYSITGCVKFLLYHFWVFPHGSDAEAMADAESSMAS